MGLRSSLYTYHNLTSPNPSFDLADNNYFKNRKLQISTPGCWHYRFDYYFYEVKRAFFEYRPAVLKSPACYK